MSSENRVLCEYRSIVIDFQTDLIRYIRQPSSSVLTGRILEVDLESPNLPLILWKKITVIMLLDV